MNKNLTTEEVQALLMKVATTREFAENSNNILKEILITRLGVEHEDTINKVIREWTEWLDDLKAEEASATISIKEEVLTRGESVTGDPLSAIWVKGRHTWDGKGLAGYAVAHPEILAFQKVGNPTCAIKETPKNEKE